MTVTLHEIQLVFGHYMLNPYITPLLCIQTRLSSTIYFTIECRNVMPVNDGLVCLQNMAENFPPSRLKKLDYNCQQTKLLSYLNFNDTCH